MNRTRYVNPSTPSRGSSSSKVREGFRREGSRQAPSTNQDGSRSSSKFFFYGDRKGTAIQGSDSSPSNRTLSSQRSRSRAAENFGRVINKDQRSQNAHQLRREASRNNSPYFGRVIRKEAPKQGRPGGKNPGSGLGRGKGSGAPSSSDFHRPDLSGRPGASKGRGSSVDDARKALRAFPRKGRGGRDLEYSKSPRTRENRNLKDTKQPNRFLSRRKNWDGGYGNGGHGDYHWDDYWDWYWWNGSYWGGCGYGYGHGGYWGIGFNWGWGSLWWNWYSGYPGSWGSRWWWRYPRSYYGNYYYPYWYWPTYWIPSWSYYYYPVYVDVPEYNSHSYHYVHYIDRGYQEEYSYHPYYGELQQYYYPEEEQGIGSEAAGGGQVAAGEISVADDAGSTGSKFDFFLKLGDFYFKKGEYKEAVDAFKDAVKARPDSAVPHFFLAEALFAQGDYQFAAFNIRKGLKLEPQFLDEIIDRRDFYTTPEDFDQQLLKLEQFVEKNPYDDEAILVLTYNYYFTRRFIDTKEALLRLGSLSPDEPALGVFLPATEKKLAEEEKKAEEAEEKEKSEIEKKEIAALTIEE